MGYKVKRDDTYDPTTAGGNNRFAALAAGKYVASVFEAELGEYGPKSGNKGRPFVKVQFRIEDGQTGANRRIFQNIGIFEKWAPTSKNPDGSDNFTFFGFFAAVTGKSEKDFREWFRDAKDPFGELPSPSQLEGRKVTLVLKVVPDDYAYNKALEEGTLEEGETQDDYTKNDISGFRVYDGAAANTSAPKVGAVEL